MKYNKAAGLSGVVLGMLKASGEAGPEWVDDVCDAVVKNGKIPEDRKKSWLASVYKGKEDMLCTCTEALKCCTFFEDL